MFVFYLLVEISQTMVSLALGKPLMHWVYGLVVFRLVMQELLNVEQFYQKIIQ